MPWKDGFLSRNKNLKWPFWGFCIVIGLVVLALVFGPDETREFGRDVAVKFGIVNPEPVPEPEEIKP